MDVCDRADEGLHTAGRAPRGAERSVRSLLRRAVALVAVLGMPACDGADTGSREGGAHDRDPAAIPSADSTADRDGGWAGTELPQPMPRPDFVLRDTEGRPYDFRAETEGRVALLFFGYTHCPDICPVHMANLAAVMDDLPYELSRHVEVVFVTVDPERDTAERLDDWLGRIDPGIVGLRGSREEIRAIEDQLGIAHSYVRPEPEGPPTVGHSARVFAFGGDGPARLGYPWGVRQRDWRLDLPRLVRETVPEASLTGS